MRIDVPYSLLVRDGDQAWTCGQLALDADANVLAADDLGSQSAIVAGYIAELVERIGLDVDHLKRLLLYYVPAVGDDDVRRVDEMRSAFRAVVGPRVLLDAVPVPYFYYDGIVLEVDAFAGPTDGDLFNWVSIEEPVENLDVALGKIDTSALLSAHWSVPNRDIASVSTMLEQRGLVHDAGAVVSAGDTRFVRGSLVQVADGVITESSSKNGDVQVTSKRCGGIGWIGARCTDGELGLVEQTEKIMDVLAATLAAEGVGFGAIVKSTTLYVGGSTEEDLHDNMSVRNRRYSKPGPASTGLPVFGLAAPASRLTVDVTYLT